MFQKVFINILLAINQRALDQTLINEIKNNNITKIQELLDNGVSVTAKDDEGNTPLHHAINMGNLQLVELLLIKNADFNARNNEDSLPIEKAVLYNKKDIVKLLISCGADVTCENDCLHSSAYDGYDDIVKLLISVGANVNYKNSVGDTPLHRASTDRITGPLFTDFNDRRPYDWNEYAKKIEIFELLINAGADINARNKWGQTAWYLANIDNAFGNPLHWAAYVGKKELVALFISNGFHSPHPETYLDSSKTRLRSAHMLSYINYHDGNTALHYAAFKGHKVIVELLLDAGVNKNIKNHINETAQDCATSQEIKDIINNYMYLLNR